jgi:hypothetical protein
MPEGAVIATDLGGAERAEPVLGGDQTGATSPAPGTPADCFSPVGCSELAEDAAEMSFNGISGEVHRAGDSLGDEHEGREAQDFALAVAELLNDHWLLVAGIRGAVGLIPRAISLHLETTHRYDATTGSAGIRKPALPVSGARSPGSPRSARVSRVNGQLGREGSTGGAAVPTHWCCPRRAAIFITPTHPRRVRIGRA